MAYKVFAHMECPDCIEAKEVLDKMKVDYELVDISRLMNLKSFLSLRDTTDAFAEIRETSIAGIPCFYDTETKECYLDLDEFLELLKLEL